MGQRRITLLLLCIAFSNSWAVGPSTKGILTNAEGGLFASGRTFWFSVPENERLSLSVNGTERYRGLGPSSLELSSVAGTVTEYELKVERLSPPPGSILLESRSFLVVIDAEPPEPPLFHVESAEDGSWVLSYSIEKRARIDAVVDSGGKRALYRSLDNGQSFPSGPLHILAWSVDAASNHSEVIGVSYKPLSLDIRNPVPGTWNNKQRLYLEVQGATTIRWTLDGTDPLGATGKDYTEGILLDGTGNLSLRVACRSEDGRILRSESHFTVNPKPYPGHSELAAAEVNPILKETSLTIPPSYRWDSSGSSPRYSASRIQLSPLRFMQRPYTLVVGNAEGLWRYLYRLGSLEKASREESPEIIKSSEMPGIQSDSKADIVPQLLRFGSARLILWPRGATHIRYRLLGTEDWEEALSPLYVPDGGLSLEWIVERGSELSPAQEFFLPPLPLQGLPMPSFPLLSNHRQTLQLDAALDPASQPPYYLSYTLGGDFGLGLSSYTSPDFPLSLEGAQELVFDACDGEELGWRLMNKSGEELSFIIDKRRPQPPQLKAPAELSWNTSAVDFSCITQEGESLETEVFKIQADGKEEFLALERPFHIPSSRYGQEKILIKARATDSAGNRSAVVTRSFIMDTPTVYVKGKPRGDPSSLAAPQGSRENPFASLGAAIDFAQHEQIPLIRMSGSLDLKGSYQIRDTLHLEGGYDSLWNLIPNPTVISFEGDADLRVQGNLEITNLDFKGLIGNRPLFSLEEASSVRFVDSSILANLSNKRSLAIRSNSATLVFERSRLGLEGTSPFVTGIESSAGSLSLISSSVLVSAKNSAFCLSLKGTRLDAENSLVKAAASDYASALDAEGSFINWKAGSLAAHSRDVALMVLSNTESSFSGAGLTVDASFAARSLDVRGRFPQLRSLSFKSVGSSPAAMAFSWH
ncbi:hypothetical protein MASR2M78_05100 [Treponema sp.]